MNSTYTVESVINEAIREVHAKQESILLEQLGDLIKDGILEIQMLQPVITQEHNINNGGVSLKMSQAIRLTHKGAEKMQELKDEVIRLKKLNTSLMEEISKSNE